MPTTEIEILKRQLENIKLNARSLKDQRDVIKDELRQIGINTPLKAASRIKSNNHKINSYQQKLSDLLDQAEDKLRTMEDY